MATTAYLIELRMTNPLGGAIKARKSIRLPAIAQYGYDAFYRWCRDATDESHNRPANKKGA
jgi:hypothetical protein